MSDEYVTVSKKANIEVLVRRADRELHLHEPILSATREDGLRISLDLIVPGTGFLIRYNDDVYVVGMDSFVKGLAEAIEKIRSADEEE